MNRNIAANYVGRVASLAANFIFVPIYVSILGVEAYAIIAFYTLLVTVTALADVGLSATFSRVAAQQLEGEGLPQLLVGAERFLLLSVGSFALILFATSGWVADNWLNSSAQVKKADIVLSLQLMSMTLTPQILLTLYLSGLLGLQHQVKANGIQISIVIIRGGLVIIPLKLQADLVIFFSWQLASTIALAFVARRSLVKSMGLNSLADVIFSWAALGPHWRYAAGMAVITLISIVNNQFDKILISRLFSMTEYSYYSIASTLAQLPIAVATPIAVAFFPQLVASISQKSSLDEFHVLTNFTRLIAFIATIGGGGLALFSSETLAVWLQDAQIPSIASRVTATLAFGSIIICLNMPAYYACLARGKTKVIVQVGAATLFISVPASFFALKALGLWGGALVWVLINVIHFVLLGAIVLRGGVSGGRRLGGHLRAMPVPIATALMPLLAARLLADWLSPPSLVACVFAGVAATIAMLAFAVSLKFWAKETHQVDC